MMLENTRNQTLHAFLTEFNKTIVILRIGRLKLIFENVLFESNQSSDEDYSITKLKDD